MNRIVFSIFLVVAVCFSFCAFSQESGFVQKVHGYITDAESKQPMGNVVVLLLPDKKLTATSDSNGYYVLENVPIGRQSFQFFYVGYETKQVPEVLVTSGK